MRNLMKISGASVILKIFEKYNIKYIFGYPGGAILPIYDELLKNKNIKHVLVRNEQAAAHAAAAYGKITNNVGVCIATSGPGATNFVTGIANAYMDSIPLIIITGQVETKFLGTDSFQEADIQGITLPITKHNYLIKNTKNIPNILHKAYKIATSGRKGPVLLDIPKNILENKIFYDYNKDIFFKNNKIKEKKYLFNHNNNKKNIIKIKKSIEIINQSKKPLFLLGGGAISSNCQKIINLFIEKFNIPVATTLMGISSYDETKKNSLGMIGIHGLETSNYALNNCDVLIAVGTRFSDRSIKFINFNKNIKIIHIDIDNAELNKNIEVDISILGDAKNILKNIYIELKKLNINSWLEKIKKIKYKNLNEKNYENLNPKYIIEILGEITRNNCIVTTDVGQHQIFVAKYYKFKNFNSFLTSGGLGVMGFGLPAAIGISFATNKLKNIILITGDGSFQMNMPELATIVENNLPIKIILMNNSSLGMVKQLQDLNYNSKYSEIFLKGNPDFCNLVSSYKNIETYRIKEKKYIKNLLEKIFSNKKTVFVECIIDNNNIV